MLVAVDAGLKGRKLGSQEAARSLLRYAGEVANLAEVLPNWQDIQRRKPNGSLVVGYRTGSPYVEPPWRYDRDDEPLIPSVDRDYLTWLCESGAQPRVLTVKEMQDVVAALLRPRLDEDAQRRLKAQRRHEEAAARVEVEVRSHRQHAEDQAAAHSRYGGTP